MSGTLQPPDTTLLNPLLPDLDSAQGYIIPFDKLCEVVLKKDNVDVLFLGDTDHSDTQIRNHLIGDRTLTSYFNSKVDLIMLEKNPEELSELMPPPHLQDTLEYIYDPTSGYHPKPFFEDPTPERFDVEDFMKRQLLRLSKTSISIVPVDEQSTEDKEAIAREAAQSLTPETTIALMLERLNLDTDLNSNIRELLLNFNKAVLLYGDLHGSRFEDGLLEDESYKMVKISVAKSKKEYKEQQFHVQRVDELIRGTKKLRDLSPSNFSEIIPRRLGKDVPHAIYFTDTKEVYLTDKMGADLQNSIIKASFPEENKIEKNIKPLKNEF